MTDVMIPAADALRREVWSAVFYASSASFTGFFILFNLALRNRGGLLYAGLFATMLFLLAAIEGHAGRVLWPEHPSWDRPLTVMIAFLVSALGFYTAEQTLNPERPSKRLRSALRGLALVSLVLAPSVLILPYELARHSANVLLLLMIGSHLASTATWRTIEDRPHRLPVLIAAVLFAAAAAIALLVFGGVDGSGSLRPAIYRPLYAVVTTLTMAVLVVNIITLRRRYEHGLLDALAASRRDAELSKALFEAERNYVRAREIAQSRGRRIASASHDIRQPIASLRTTIDAVARDQPPSVRRQLRDSLDYIEGLASGLLGNRSFESGQALRNDEATQDRPEPISIDLVMETAVRMFRAEAKEKGSALTAVPSSAKVLAPPLVLMRIVNNALTNAIAHASATRILIGCRRMGTTVRLDVIDNGAGIAADRPDALLAPYAKGERSGGEGLGLAIARDLAEAHGMTFEIKSVPGAGTRFSVTLKTSTPP